jgi:hypothetical protein
MRKALATLLAAGLLGAVAPAAAGARIHSFAGDCGFQGAVAFDPPATNTAQSLTYDYTADGTCSGTLDGQTISDAPVAERQAGDAYDGCTGARTTSPGHGAIVFPDGTRIAYTLEFSFVLTEGDYTFAGSRGGSAHGHGSFLTQRTPPDVPLRCAGDGVTEVPLDLSLTTDTPLLSGGKRKG